MQLDNGTSQAATAGTDGLGGGGGGGYAYSNASIAKDGGDGVVILRVPTARYTGTTTGSPTVTTTGTDTVIKFTASGSYTGVVMTIFAKVLDGVVVEVLNAEAEFFDTYIDSSPGTWIKTFKNAQARHLKDIIMLV